MLKILLFLALLWVFAAQLQKINWSSVTDLSLEHPFYLFLAVLFVFVNWGFEWLKWNEVLILSNAHLSRKAGVRPFLAGIITGLLTPNMLGNFIGRMFYFQRRERPAIILLTLFGNTAQFLASIFFGIVALLWLGISDPDFSWTLESFVVFMSLIILVLSVLYFRFEKIPLRFIQHNKWMGRLMPLIGHTNFFRSKILFFSLLRHATFSLQYLFVLKAFGLDVTVEWLGWIWQVFFWATLIPSLWFGKLVIRESMALWILGPVSGNPAVILFASVLLWVMNQGIPAAAGIPYLGKKNKSVVS